MGKFGQNTLFTPKKLFAPTPREHGFEFCDASIVNIEEYSTSSSDATDIDWTFIILPNDVDHHFDQILMTLKTWVNRKTLETSA